MIFNQILYDILFVGLFQTDNFQERWKLQTSLLKNLQTWYTRRYEKAGVFEKRNCSELSEPLVREVSQMTHNSISSRGFIKVNWFSQEAKIAWTELLYKKNIPLDGQTRWAKPSSQQFNLPGAWTLMKPLLKYSLHDCAYMCIR